MLQAMINRSDNTQKLCEKSESRLKSMLYDTLGVLLEGMNDMALRDIVIGLGGNGSPGSQPGRALFFASARRNAR